MSNVINLHDARALALIDRALDQGFSKESVAQILEALKSASHADRDQTSQALREAA